MPTAIKKSNVGSSPSVAHKRQNVTSPPRKVLHKFRDSPLNEEIQNNNGSEETKKESKNKISLKKELSPISSLESLHSIKNNSKIKDISDTVATTRNLSPSLSPSLSITVSPTDIPSPSVSSIDSSIFDIESSSTSVADNIDDEKEINENNSKNTIEGEREKEKEIVVANKQNSSEIMISFEKKNSVNDPKDQEMKSDVNVKENINIKDNNDDENIYNNDRNDNDRNDININDVNTKNININKDSTPQDVSLSDSFTTNTQTNLSLSSSHEVEDNKKENVDDSMKKPEPKKRGRKRKIPLPEDSKVSIDKKEPILEAKRIRRYPLRSMNIEKDNDSKGMHSSKTVDTQEKHNEMKNIHKNEIIDSKHVIEVSNDSHIHNDKKEHIEVNRRGRPSHHNKENKEIFSDVKKEKEKEIKHNEDTTGSQKNEKEISIKNKNTVTEKDKRRRSIKIEKEKDKDDDKDKKIRGSRSHENQWVHKKEIILSDNDEDDEVDDNDDNDDDDDEYGSEEEEKEDEEDEEDEEFKEKTKKKKDFKEEKRIEKEKMEKEIKEKKEKEEKEKKEKEEKEKKEKEEKEKKEKEEKEMKEKEEKEKKEKEEKEKDQLKTKEEKPGKEEEENEEEEEEGKDSDSDYNSVSSSSIRRNKDLFSAADDAKINSYFCEDALPITGDMVCAGCGRRGFNGQSGLTTHLRSHCKAIPEGTWRDFLYKSFHLPLGCTFCQKCRGLIHMTSTNVYSCKQCGIEYIHQECLEEGKETFICKECIRNGSNKKKRKRCLPPYVMPSIARSNKSKQNNTIVKDITVKMETAMNIESKNTSLGKKEEDKNISIKNSLEKDNWTSKNSIDPLQIDIIEHNHSNNQYLDTISHGISQSNTEDPEDGSPLDTSYSLSEDDSDYDITSRTSKRSHKKSHGNMEKSISESSHYSRGIKERSKKYHISPIDQLKEEEEDMENNIDIIGNNNKLKVLDGPNNDIYENSINNSVKEVSIKSEPEVTSMNNNNNNSINAKNIVSKNNSLRSEIAKGSLKNINIHTTNTSTTIDTSIYTSSLSSSSTTSLIPISEPLQSTDLHIPLLHSSLSPSLLPSSTTNSSLPTGTSGYFLDTPSSRPNSRRNSLELGLYPGSMNIMDGYKDIGMNVGGGIDIDMYDTIDIDRGYESNHRNSNSLYNDSLYTDGYINDIFNNDIRYKNNSFEKSLEGQDLYTEKKSETEQHSTLIDDNIKKEPYLNDGLDMSLDSRNFSKVNRIMKHPTKIITPVEPPLVTCKRCSSLFNPYASTPSISPFIPVCIEPEVEVVKQEIEQNTMNPDVLLSTSISRPIGNDFMSPLANQMPTVTPISSMSTNNNQSSLFSSSSFSPLPQENHKTESNQQIEKIDAQNKEHNSDIANIDRLFYCEKCRSLLERSKSSIPTPLASEDYNTETVFKIAGKIEIEDLSASEYNHLVSSIETFSLPQLLQIHLLLSKSLHTINNKIKQLDQEKTKENAR
ncbi:hypothetical protein WA158_003841 [Blastocystis sp. Blastoise]